MQELLAAVCEYYRVTEEQLARRSSRHPARSVLALLAQRHTAITQRELSTWLGIAGAGSLSYLLRRASQASQDSAEATAINQIEALLRLR